MSKHNKLIPLLLFISFLFAGCSAPEDDATPSGGKPKTEIPQEETNQPPVNDDSTDQNNDDDEEAEDEIDPASVTCSATTTPETLLAALASEDYASACATALQEDNSFDLTEYTKSFVSDTKIEVAILLLKAGFTAPSDYDDNKWNDDDAGSDDDELTWAERGWSSTEGHIKLAGILRKDTDSDVNTTASGEGDTALMWSIFNGHTEIAKQLLEIDNINVNLQDTAHKNTALIIAAFYGRTELVEKLLYHLQTKMPH